MAISQPNTPAAPDYNGRVKVVLREELVHLLRADLLFWQQLKGDRRVARNTTVSLCEMIHKQRYKLKLRGVK